MRSISLLALFALGSAACGGDETQVSPTDASVAPDITDARGDDVSVVEPDQVGPDQVEPDHVEADQVEPPDGSSADAPDAPTYCVPLDAGDAAWVRRAVAALLGRLPLGAAEVDVLTKAVNRLGRTEVARALMASSEFEQRWVEALRDIFHVQRFDDKANNPCFGERKLASDDGALAEHVRDNGPAGPPFAEPFSLDDVLRSSLHIDDLSPFLRVNLFAVMARPVPYCSNTSLLDMDLARRLDFATRVHELYLGRDMECLPCHNTEYAVTDDPDPALDRHWPLPGLADEAIFGASAGRPELEAASVFRYQGVVTRRSLLDDEEWALWPSDASPGVSPWGMAEVCGVFSGPDEVIRDQAEIEAFLGTPLGVTGSIWDFEGLLSSGVAALRGVGLPVQDQQQVAPDKALALLVATRLADRVWQVGMGSPLTLPHGFSRNAAQLGRLRGLAEGVLRDGWSLRGLLQAILADELFNVAPAVEGCVGGSGYALAPVLDPISVEALDALERGNSPADAVFRPSGRTLMRRIFAALEWTELPAFPDPASDLATEAALGAYLSNQRIGHAGIGPQTLIVLESTLGLCRPTRPTGSEPGCTGSAEACFTWDLPPDFVDRLMALGIAQQAALRDVVLALRDRLGIIGAIDDEEAATVADLFRVPDLDAPFAGVPERSAALRAYCGVLLLSPQFLLDGLVPAEVGAHPRLAPFGASARAVCERHLPALQSVGLDGSCGEGGLVVSQ